VLKFELNSPSVEGQNWEVTVPQAVPVDVARGASTKQLQKMRELGGALRRQG
jgi:hypothetical protein